MKKVIMRRCVVTGENHDKRELLRVVRTPEGTVVIDKSGKLNGRGAYLLKSKDVIVKAQKKDALSHALNVQVPPEIYEKLLEEVSE